MRIGIPTEVKDNEYRVALTPAGVHEFTGRGHEVFVQAGAGAGSSITDADYTAAGAKVLDTADEVWGQAELLLKVKEPIAAVSSSAASRGCTPPRSSSSARASRA